MSASEEPKSAKPPRQPQSRERAPTRTAVYAPYDPRAQRINSVARAPADRLAEAVGLAEAIALDVVAQGVIPLARRTPATLIGSGKVESIAAEVKEQEIELVIIDQALTPGQQRNLEKAFGAKVLDRTGLILEIFGERAATKEGRLQVELAHLVYQKSRLVRSWTHLERQRGGAGFLGGPGETQMEVDRRLLQDRIDGILADLEQVKRTRELHRKGRRRVPYPVVALVGYTNAGKSTLFNRLTGAAVLAKDMLFATLDPTMREVVLPSGRKVILSDTVGFISELPTSLIAAFRATLEEVTGADLILHVRDIAHADSEAQRGDVEKVLGDLGIAAKEATANILEVWNKIDLMSEEAREIAVNRAQRAEPLAIPVSAATGEGLDRLIASIDERLASHHDEIVVEVSPALGALVNWLHEQAEVIEQAATDTGDLRLTVRIGDDALGRLKAKIAQAGPERARLV
ncbi:MAG: GTPase HflX [Hyphomicrobiaceae bacterium]